MRSLFSFFVQIAKGNLRAEAGSHLLLPNLPNADHVVVAAGAQDDAVGVERRARYAAVQFRIRHLQHSSLRGNQIEPLRVGVSNIPQHNCASDSCREQPFCCEVIELRRLE